MRPDHLEILAGVRRGMLEHMAPEVTSVFGRSQLGYATNLLLAVARELDDLVPRYLAENRELRQILGRGARVLAPAQPDLAGELAAAAKGPRAPDLRVSALRTENARLMALFIRAQAAAEETPGPSAKAYWRRTLRFLHERSERQTAVQPFVRQ